MRTSGREPRSGDGAKDREEWFAAATISVGMRGIKKNRSELVRWMTLLFLGLIAAGPATRPTTLPTSVEVRDIQGNPWRPLDVKKGEFAVMIVALPDCPNANAYAPEINRIVEEFTPQGVRFTIVQADVDASDEILRKHAADFGYKCRVIADRERVWVKRLGASYSPEAAVVSAGGDLLYLGRIDDRFPVLGKKRLEPTTRDLREALRAVLQGRPVAVPRTRAVGCRL